MLFRSLPAEGVLRFSVESPAAEDLPIEAGCVAMTAEGQRFVTTADAVLQAGELSVDAAARAAEAGAAGNVAAGTIRLMAVAPVGVKRCVNPRAFTGGADEEGDEALRGRILDSYRRLPNGANAAYYEQQAMTFPGVAAAKAVGRPRGVGSVDVYVAVRNGTPDQELLQAVADWLEERREIAVDLQVLAPAAETVNLSVKLLPAEGVSFQEAKTAAEGTLRNFFTGELLGRGVTLAELGHRLYSLAEVANYRIVSPGTDLPAAVGRLPVLGTLTLTEMEAG